MKEQAQLLKYHTAATLKIQAAWRMYRVQCQIDEMHEYAFKIQRFYHIFRAYKIVASFIRRRRYVKARAFDELKVRASVVWAQEAITSMSMPPPCPDCHGLVDTCRPQCCVHTQ